MLNLKYSEDTLPIQNDAIQGVQRRNSDNVCYLSVQKHFPSRFLHKSHRLKCYQP